MSKRKADDSAANAGPSIRRQRLDDMEQLFHDLLERGRQRNAAAAAAAGEAGSNGQRNNGSTGLMPVVPDSAFRPPPEPYRNPVREAVLHHYTRAITDTPGMQQLRALGFHAPPHVGERKQTFYGEFAGWERVPGEDRVVATTVQDPDWSVHPYFTNFITQRLHNLSAEDRLQVENDVIPLVSYIQHLRHRSGEIPNRPWQDFLREAIADISNVESERQAPLGSVRRDIARLRPDGSNAEANRIMSRVHALPPHLRQFVQWPLTALRSTFTMWDSEINWWRSEAKRDPANLVSNFERAAAAAPTMELPVGDIKAQDQYFRSQLAYHADRTRDGDHQILLFSPMYWDSDPLLERYHGSLADAERIQLMQLRPGEDPPAHHIPPAPPLPPPPPPPRPREWLTPEELGMSPEQIAALGRHDPIPIPPRLDPQQESERFWERYWRDRGFSRPPHRPPNGFSD